MKNIKKNLAFLMLISALAGCSKEEISKTLNENDNITKSVSLSNYPSESNGWLRFENPEDFENYMTEISKYQYDELPDYENVTSMIEAIIANGQDPTEEDIYQDEIFMTVLNENHLLQIGNKIFNVDKANEKVFVLDAERISEANLNDLINGTGEFIRNYSTDDEVLSFEFDGFNPKCGQTAAANKRDKNSTTDDVPYTYTVNNVDYVIKAQLAYVKYGITNRMWAEI